MSGMWCDDEYEHRREARDDFHRRGYYGYDRERYRNHWDACDEAYTQEFDRLRREEDARRAEEERQDRRAEQLRYERIEQERHEYEAMMYVQEPTAPEPEPQHERPEDDEPAPVDTP